MENEASYKVQADSKRGSSMLDNRRLLIFVDIGRGVNRLNFLQDYSYPLSNSNTHGTQRIFSV